MSPEAGTVAIAAPPNRTAGPRFKLLTAEQVAALPPPRWLLTDILVERAFAVLYGPPGVGKSFVALDMALSVATGASGVAEPAVCGPVVYVVAEAGSGLSNRIGAWSTGRGIKPEQAHFLLEPVSLLDRREVQALIQAIQPLSESPRLLVIDTMARCLVGGDENSSKDVGLLVEGIGTLQKTLGCAVVLVHHGTKNEPKVERGSSALRGAADAMFRLEQQGGHLLLTCEKQKDAAPFDALLLTLSEVTLRNEETSCLVNRARDNVIALWTSSPQGRVVQEEMLSILTTRPDGVPHGDWKRLYLAPGGRNGTAFARGLRSLKAQGRIRAERGRYKPQCQLSDRCETGVTTPEPVS